MDARRVKLQCFFYLAWDFPTRGGDSDCQMLFLQRIWMLRTLRMFQTSALKLRLASNDSHKLVSASMRKEGNDHRRALMQKQFM